MSKNKKTLYIHSGNNPMPQEHNYVKKLLQMRDAGLIPDKGSHRVDIYHDDWCKINSGGWCNCNPEITVKKTG